MIFGGISESIGNKMEKIQTQKKTMIDKINSDDLVKKDINSFSKSLNANQKATI